MPIALIFILALLASCHKIRVGIHTTPMPEKSSQKAAVRSEFALPVLEHTVEIPYEQLIEELIEKESAEAQIGMVIKTRERNSTLYASKEGSCPGISEESRTIQGIEAKNLTFKAHYRIDEKPQYKCPGLQVDIEKAITQPIREMVDFEKFELESMRIRKGSIGNKVHYLISGRIDDGKIKGQVHALLDPEWPPNADYKFYYFSGEDQGRYRDHVYHRELILP